MLLGFSLKSDKTALKNDDDSEIIMASVTLESSVTEEVVIRQTRDDRIVREVLRYMKLVDGVACRTDAGRVDPLEGKLSNRCSCSSSPENYQPRS